MKIHSRHWLALAITLAVAAACNQAQNLGEGGGESTAPDAGSPTLDGSSGVDPSRDSGSSQDASSGDSGPVSADGGPSACAGNTPCDPLANTGCSGSLSCQVSWTSQIDSKAACATTFSSASDVFGRDCPCAPGLTCFPDVGICYRLCDYTHGTPALDKSGKPYPDTMNDNPECLADPEAQRNGYTTCHKIGSCFGVCDVLAEIP